MAKLHVTQGDTEPDIQATLSRADGSNPDLTNATVDFIATKPRGGANIINASCSISNATGGEVTYVWSSGDTSDSGRYRAEFKVTYPDGEVEHFPNDGTHTLLIHDNMEA